jgi:3-hydroxyacyl-CoA dehydrogenase
MTEAMRMLERGDASAQDIDTAMKLGCGYPMGPIDADGLRRPRHDALDRRGLDQALPERAGLHGPGGCSREGQEGKLGRKTGEGFYKWEGDKRA